MFPTKSTSACNRIESGIEPESSEHPYYYFFSYHGLPAAFAGRCGSDGFESDGRDKRTLPPEPDEWEYGPEGGEEADPDY